jgi:DNA topoisomerase-1
MTKVFQVCSGLGASTNEINRMLEYLYLQKFISYPRSKSERWEIEDKDAKMDYSMAVLEAIESCGYPVKEYYYKTTGNEGTVSHSHPCIHPLPSITPEKVKRLKKVSPIGFIILNQIIIHTLKSFEKKPRVKIQKITYKISQGDFEKKFSKKYMIKLLEENILSFEGLHSNTDFVKELPVDKGDTYTAFVEKKLRKIYTIEKNHQEVRMLNDFDVINFLNENDIGTDATRTITLNTMISLQYFVSSNILLTTLLGNTLSEIANRYIDFIDIEYTLTIEEYLDKIESGIMEVDEFKAYVKQLIRDTYEEMMEKKDEINEIFMDVPKCEVHDIPMIIKSGRFGKFLQCPYFYVENKKCNQKISI